MVVINDKESVEGLRNTLAGGKYNEYFAGPNKRGRMYVLSLRSDNIVVTGSNRGGKVIETNAAPVLKILVCKEEKKRSEYFALIELVNNVVEEALDENRKL